MSYDTAQLDRLDAKWGRTVKLSDCQVISEKAQHTPAQLTDDELLVLEGFYGQAHADNARARRTKALAPPPAPAAEPAPAATTATGSKLVTLDVLHKALDMEAAALADVLADYVTARLAPVLARLAALESRPHLKYAGPFRTGDVYAEGALVTHQGSLWLAESPTTYAPGAAGSGWRLVVKRGEAAR